MSTALNAIVKITVVNSKEMRKVILPYFDKKGATALKFYFFIK